MMSSVIKNAFSVRPSGSLVQVKVKRVTVSIHPQRRSVVDHVNDHHSRPLLAMRLSCLVRDVSLVCGG